MIEVQLPDGRVIEVPTTDPQAAANAAKAFLSRGGAPAGDNAAAARQRLSQESSGPGGAISAGAQGFNIGLSNVLGLPVDAVNNLPRLFGGSKIAEQPFLGSDSIKAGLNAVGALNVNDVSEIDPTYRPFARAGEVFGGAVPFAAAPLAAARAVAPALGEGGLVQQIVQSAARNPTQFAARELGTTAGAAQGAALAQVVAPDNALAGIAGEVAGAFASPLSIVSRLAGVGVDGAQRAFQSFTPGGRERAAAQRLGVLLKDAGEDPQAILKALEKTDDFGFSLAERSQSPTLLGLRQIAMKENPDIARRALEGDQAAVVALGQRMREILDPGDAADLTRTATARVERGQELAARGQQRADEAFTQRIAAAQQSADDIVRRAEEEAKAALDPFRNADAASRQNASLGARKALDDAYDKVRQIERSVWSAVPQDAPVVPRGLLQARDEFVTSNDLYFQQSNAVVRSRLAEIADAARQGFVPSSKEMLQLRSDLLDLARDARSGATPSRKLASIYDTLAGRALDDLGALEGTKEARSFSKALHDRFSRTFAGDVLRLRSTGADAVSDVQTLERAMAGNPAARQQQMQELVDATSPIPFEYRGVRGRTTDFSPQMQAAQEEFLRANAAQFINPTTGAIDARRAAVFLRDNEPMLTRFPAVRDALQEAVAKETARAPAADMAKQQFATAKSGAQAQLDARAATLKAYERQLNQSAFARVVNAGEQPHRVVEQVVRGANPAQDYAALAQVARRGGPEALGGLRAATFDYLQRAAVKDGQISFKALTETLLNPNGTAGQNLLASMRTNGVITTTQEARLRQALTRGLQHEGSAAIARAPASVTGEVGDMFDFLVRIAGANYGAGVSIIGSNSGAPLVAASAGSKLARNLAEKIPASRVKDILFKSLEDEELLKALLTKVDAKSARRIGRQIDAALLSTGSRAASDELE